MSNLISKIHINGDIFKHLINKMRYIKITLNEKETEYLEMKGGACDCGYEISISNTNKNLFIIYKQNGRKVNPHFVIMDNKNNIIILDRITECYLVEEDNENNEIILGDGVFTSNPIRISLLKVEPHFN